MARITNYRFWIMTTAIGWIGGVSLLIAHQ
jgi:hypothetical protein